MIPKFFSLGVETLLKIICEKIIIKDIQIINKINNLNGIIDQLNIKAESIIFKKINISNINIQIRGPVLRLIFDNKKFLIENCDALIHLRLTSENINKTLFNKKWISLKTSIESFILMKFQSIEINKKSLYFVPLEGLPNIDTDYTLQYDETSILLVNNINKEKLSILNDKNINVKNLIFFENYIDIELSSKIIIN